MAKRKEEAPAPGAPAWMATFGDLMNLLLCFFVLLFSMSSIDAAKFEQMAASMAQAFSIFSGGATSIGDGILVSNGVSQLNELAEYINSTGKFAEGEGEELEQLTEAEKNAIEEVQEQGLQMSEQMAEQIDESLKEQNLDKEIDIDITSQYVSLTMNGALLFDSGSAELKEESLQLMQKVGVILQSYAENLIEVEGHTDNIPIRGGTYAGNDELSCFRALSVFHFLDENTAIPAAQMKYSGRGEHNPIADNSTPEGRAKNRRVEIRIYNTISMYE